MFESIAQVSESVKALDFYKVFPTCWQPVEISGQARTVIKIELFRQVSSRGHMALVAAVIAIAVHGMFVASEDFRHLWAFIGLIGLAGIPAAPPSRDTAEGSAG